MYVICLFYGVCLDRQTALSVTPRMYFEL